MEKEKQLSAVILAVLIYRNALLYGANISSRYIAQLLCELYLILITQPQFGFTGCGVFIWS